jgi:hypothetical protein
MDETNNPKIYVVGTLFFWNQSNLSGVETMEIGNTYIQVNGIVNQHFLKSPLSQNFSQKSIRSH